MPFPYKKALITGATSGIGRAMAIRLASEGAHVIATGRRTENLDELQKEVGADKISTITLDVSDLSNTEKVVKDITSQHPDLDCVIFNAGIQRAWNFNQPETVDFKTVQEELATNYTSVVQMTFAFLPFLRASNNKTSLVYVTSGLAIVPLARCPGYCASKAALHAFILCLRQQIQDSSVKVMEVLPPLVQTELHDEKHQPDLKNGHQMGIPLDQFTNDAYAGLEKEEETIFVSAPPAAKELEFKRQDIMQSLWAMVKKTLPS